MGQDDRDKKFERALMRHLRGADAARGAEPAGVGGEEAGCPDAEMLAAFLERMLTNEEMNATKEHVAGCSRCQEILTLLESTDDVVAALDGLQDVAHPRASILSTGALYVAPIGGSRTRAAAAAASPVNAQQSPVEISGGRGFRTWRWIAPAGAIAAGLFIWVVTQQPKYHPSSPSGHLQVAQERAENDRLTTAYSAPSPQIAPVPAPGPSSSGRSAQPAEEKQKSEGNLSEQLTARNIPLNGRETSGLARMAPATSGGTAPSSAGNTSRTADASGAPARPSGRFMAKTAVAPPPLAPALAKPRVSEPDVRKDDRMASARADRRTRDGNEAGNGNAANASAAERAKENGRDKLDQPARQEAGSSNSALGPAASANSAPASVASSTGSRAQGVAGASKPSDAAAQKSANNAGEAAVAAQQVEITNALEDTTSSSLKKVNGARGKIILTPDGTVVWRLGGGGNVERSVDSGTTWVRQSTGSSRGLLAGSAPNEVTCWVVGRKGTILVSTDGGGHWSAILSPIGGDIVRVTAADALHAVIWGPNGTAFATADGGKTWSAAK